MSNDIKAAQAVPLTPEIFEQYGFIQHHDDCSNGIIYVKDIFSERPFKWGVYPEELGSGIVVKNAKPIQYLHELVNLHYCITGNFMERKPTTNGE